MRACCAWSAALRSLTSCTSPSGPQLPTPSGLAAPVSPSRSCTCRLVPLLLKRGSFAGAVKWFSPRTVIVTPLPRVARPRTNPHAAVVHAALFTSVGKPVVSGAASVIVCAAARAVRSALRLLLAAARRATLGVSAMLDAIGLSHPERVACLDILDAEAPSSCKAFVNFHARARRCCPASQPPRLRRVARRHAHLLRTLRRAQPCSCWARLAGTAMRLRLKAETTLWQQVICLWVAFRPAADFYT